jgi:hypothetical protein
MGISRTEKLFIIRLAMLPLFICVYLSKKLNHSRYERSYLAVYK